MSPLYLLILFTVIMAFGIVGILIPVVPGIPLMFVLALLYGIINKFATLTGRELLFLGVIALASFLIDYLSGVLGAKYGGASKKALTYGLIGTIIGFIVIPPFGSLIGLFIGVLVGELIAGRSHEKAIHAAKTSVLGSLAGIGINILLGLIFIILFVIFSLR